MISLIILCSLVGTVLLIGVCAPLSVTTIPTAPPSTVIVEPFQNGRDFNANQDGGVSGESIGEDAIKADFRKRIASSSVPILRSRGMTDKKIKSELLRDFALTEEQVDEIIAAQ